MKKIILILGLISCCYQSWATQAEGLQQKLNALHSMTAHFKQTVFEGHAQIQQSSGTLYLQRPGKFRWLTAKPSSQLIVSDGKTLWIYDEDLEQVSIKQLNKEVQGTPALFLSGYDEKISAQFDVAYKTKKGLDNYTLTPKKNIRSQYLWIELSYLKNKLQQLKFKDKLGQQTVVLFSRVDLKPTLKPELFSFSPPAGVDVVE